MAPLPWAIVKLLHPFTADDLLVSRRIVSSLDLPPSTSQFVLALPADPRAPETVVYVLAVEKLSERSIDDIEALVAAVKPRSVVALVDEQDVAEISEEGDLLNSPESLDVPSSIFQVVKRCFSEKLKVSGYESRAALRVLTNLFGTSFHGNVHAARKAAQEVQAEFEYLAFPTTSLLTDVDQEEDEDNESDDRDSIADVRTSIGGSNLGYGDRFLASFSAFLGGNFESPTRLSPRVPTLSNLRPRSKEFRTLATPLTTSLSGQVKGTPFLSANTSQVPPVEGPEAQEVGWPAFSAPFYSLFLDLHELFRETPGVDQALNSARNLLTSVDHGDEVDQGDLSRARLFRVAVESVRISWKSFVRSDRTPSAPAVDFSDLPFEEKCQALLAHALQHQARKFQTVVAVVDASSVPGIRRHWNTPIPPDVAEYTEFCFLAWDFGDSSKEGKTFNILESRETKAAVAVSAGAVTAASLVSLPQWVSVSTFMKVFSVKIPAVLKLAWLQLKRQAAYGLTSSLTTASKIVTPTFKGVASGKALVGPTSATKAMLLKATSAEKVRAAAHSVVAAAERASLQAIRTAFYSLMRSRQAKILGPRPWVVLGSSLAMGCGVLWFGDEMEHGIVAVPSAPSVVRLSRGLESLEEASKRVNDSEDGTWWDGVYSSVYGSPQQF